MKWNIISHNIRGLNDPESQRKKRHFLTSIIPRVDIMLLQEHKLRGMAIDNLGARLMPSYNNWILEATQGERSWLNPNVAGKEGIMGILLAHKYVRLVTAHGAHYEDKVV